MVVRHHNPNLVCRNLNYLNDKMLTTHISIIRSYLHSSLAAYYIIAEPQRILLTTIEQITGSNLFFLVGKDCFIRLRRRRGKPHVTGFSIIPIHILSLTIAVTNILCFPKRLRSCSMLL